MVYDQVCSVCIGSYLGLDIFCSFFYFFDLFVDVIGNFEKRSYIFFPTEKYCHCA